MRICGMSVCGDSNQIIGLLIISIILLVLIIILIIANCHSGMFDCSDNSKHPWQMFSLVQSAVVHTRRSYRNIFILFYYTQ